MNIVEFIVCLVYVIVGGAIAFWCGAHFGAVGYVIGFLVGSLATVVVLALIAAAVFWLERRISVGVPHYPACRNGCCSADDYKIAGVAPQTTLICQCGDEYDKRGKRFVRIGPDGGEIPYLRWKPFGSWVADD
ncbi:MAG TPA: hypothetical protein VF472_01865 [Burkholderiaceae bacterium]